MPQPVDRRRDIPRRLVVTLLDRAIAEMPPRAQMTGAEVADLLLDLRLGIEAVERLPWKADAEFMRLVRGERPEGPIRRRRRLLRRRGACSPPSER